MKRRTMMGTAAAAAVAPKAFAQSANEKIRKINFYTWPQAALPQAYQASQLIAQEWRKLGLDIDVKPLQRQAQTALIWYSRDKWDTTMWRMVGRPERSDPDEFVYSLFHSSSMEKGYDFRHYVCPTLEGSVLNSRLGTMTFGYNRYIGGAPDSWASLPGTGTWRDSKPYKIAQIQQSSSYALFVCRDFLGDGIGSGGNSLWFRQDSAAETGAYASPNAYHSVGGLLHNQHGMAGTYVGWSGFTYPKLTGYVNIAFVDGSVRSIATKVDSYPAKAIEGVYIRPDHPTPKW